MPRFRVRFTRSAEKEFARLARSVQERFAAAIDALAENPTRARPGVDIKRLHGARSTWRLRVGHSRGIFEVEGEAVVFTRFGHRSRVYDV